VDQAVGVAVGGTRLRGARVAADGTILDWREQRTEGSAEAIVAAIHGLVRSLDGPGVGSVGIGVPGRVANGRMLSGGFVDFAGIPLAETLADVTGRPVTLDNDAAMALWGEVAAGAARGMREVVLFTIGTGIGGAVLAGGAPLRGRANAGQLGHIGVVQDGTPCKCGRRGCVETTSSGTALGATIAAAGLPPATRARDLVRRAEQGDPVARRILEVWALPMRAAIDTAVAAFDPELVLLGGGLGGDMHAALARFPAVSPWFGCPVTTAALGDRAGVVGAALSSLREAAR
jgi:glucokinase